MRKKVLFVDTETTGLINLRTSYDLMELWPHVIQLTAILCDCEFTDKGASVKELEVINYYTNSDVELSDEIVSLTGITPEFLKANAKSLDFVIKEFLRLFGSADMCCAHNAVFDMKMIKAEMLRLYNKTGDPLYRIHLRCIPWIDTVYYGTKVCNIRTKNNRLKFPSLSELYSRVVDSKLPEGLHSSLADARALIECFTGMSSSQLFSENHIRNLLKAKAAKDAMNNVNIDNEFE